MGGGVDAHGHAVRVLGRDPLVHVEEVAVLLADHGGAQPLDGVGEVQVHAVARLAHAAALVADLLGVARGHVARDEVAEARVLALQVVVALVLRYLARRALVALLLRDPDPPVVAQRLAHQRQLRLVLARHRDAGGMDLREARVAEGRPPLVGAPDIDRFEEPGRALQRLLEIVDRLISQPPLCIG